MKANVSEIAPDIYRLSKPAKKTATLGADEFAIAVRR